MDLKYTVKNISGDAIQSREKQITSSLNLRFYFYINKTSDEQNHLRCDKKRDFIIDLNKGKTTCRRIMC